jgi:hypothetical protein
MFSRWGRLVYRLRHVVGFTPGLALGSILLANPRLAERLGFSHVEDEPLVLLSPRPAGAGG